jgi:hypothetical protein
MIVTECDYGNLSLSDLRQYQQNVSTSYQDNLIRLLRTINPMQFKDCHLETGLCKQMILSGL